ncbi:Tetratricopeptide Repeat Protein 41-Like [Manis pentadactyla]|nr:Tetratricopeptide Repeat Protein 41-Like [Manis pentadactyla]
MGFTRILRNAVNIQHYLPFIHPSPSPWPLQLSRRGVPSVREGVKWLRIQRLFLNYSVKDQSKEVFIASIKFKLCILLLNGIEELIGIYGISGQKELLFRVHICTIKFTTGK